MVKINNIKKMTKNQLEKIGLYTDNKELIKINGNLFAKKNIRRF